MSSFERINWKWVQGHYDLRLRFSKDMIKLFQSSTVQQYAELAVGLADPSGNYSAAEHALGGRILNSNPRAEERIFDLAKSFIPLKSARTVPELIKNAQLAYLGISVGSEISCMINPSVCWVANKRTIWAHLVIKHHDNIEKANTELDLYNDADATSKMAYAKWAEIHGLLETSMTRICEMGQTVAHSKGVEGGTATYLWADAIACNLYDEYHSKT